MPRPSVLLHQPHLGLKMKISLLNNDISKFSSCLVTEEARVGEISADRSAVIGRNGWCFIYEGSNNYRAGYLNKDVEGVGYEWGTLVETRRVACENLGAKFLQIIVPNKLSIQAPNFPEQLDTDLSYILQNFLSTPSASKALVSLETFRLESVRDAVFRRNDSHLTLGGSALLTELVLERFGISPNGFATVVTRHTQHKGDLGGKFAPVVEETLAVPSFGEGLLDKRNIEKVRESISPSFNGTHQVFMNLNAPINAKIVVFGNSFFERVPSWGMSPFFAALFSEFHFYWSPNVDFEYVAREKPDYIIAQTCERFMSKLPEDKHA